MFTKTNSSHQVTLPPCPTLQSERNDAFYNTPGVVFMYPKHLVYPQKGGEFPMEMLRASLPQYRPMFPNDSGGGEEDMEMTLACPVNITMNIPVIPSLFGQKKTLGNANKENVQTSKSGLKAQQALQQPSRAVVTRFQDQSLAVEEELERLCAEKDKLLPQKPPPHTQQVDIVDEAELELEKLVLEKSSVRSAHQESLREKENILCPPSQPKKGFEFTPNTVDGGCSWPVRGETR